MDNIAMDNIGNGNLAVMAAHSSITAKAMSREMVYF